MPPFSVNKEKCTFTKRAITAQLLRFPSNCEILTIEVDLMRELVDDCHSFQAFSSQSRGDAHRAMRRLTIWRQKQIHTVGTRRKELLR